LLLSLVISACGLAQPGTQPVLGVLDLAQPGVDTLLGPREQALVERVTMPKWLSAPALDGECGDLAYTDAGAEPVTLQDSQGITSKRGWLLHTTLDAFLCIEDLPPGFSSLAVRVDGDHSRSAMVGPGDYEFSTTRDTLLSVAQGNGAGEFVPFAIPTADFEAAVRPDPASRWDAELRISLEWLGGYARLDGLSLETADEDGAVLRWPVAAERLAPATWGELDIAPRYPDPVAAGAAFLDGQEGYLVVPYAPALNPPAITIEAWVNVAGGDCGTIVGNGQIVSYWLALCDVVAFGHSGVASVRTGQTSLGTGWHHVAVTMESLIEGEGVRYLYVDGVLDTRPGWEPAEEESNGAPRQRP
jgi:hypothetical protein